MILIAPTAFKGTLSPSAAARAIAAGIESSASLDREVCLCPLADGGDGMIESANLSIGGEVRSLSVQGPTGETVQARWLEFNRGQHRIALVELANACGIAYLSQEQLQPLNASTYGLGEVIAACYHSGIRNIKIGIGGSASTDGGMGALVALGVQFFTASGDQVPPAGGAVLNRIERCSFDKLKLQNCVLEILTDVENPLLGANGAAAVFAPQKGANPEEVAFLERSLAHFAEVLERTTGHQVRSQPGAGAAGGAGFGLACGLGATIRSGFDWIAQTAHLDEKIQRSSLVITGEGRFDSQSLSGKVIGSLSKKCSQLDRPLWVVAGSADLVGAESGVERVIVPPSKGGFCTDQDIKNAIARSF